ncbi:MAG: PKD domain-containing protein, partial [Bacteroidota bacterium]
MFRRLELAGFQISLATRLRALKVLSGPGKELLQEPRKLKSFLCPIIARTPAEQERFYDLFDAYADDLFKPLKPSKDSIKAPHQQSEEILKKIPHWFWYLLSAMGFLCLALILYQTEAPQPKPPKAFFRHDRSVKVGDSLYITNQSEELDTSHYDFIWEILDSETGRTEIKEENTFHWHYFAHGKGDADRKIIRLSVQHKSRQDSIHRYESDFEIHCTQPPNILDIIAPTAIAEGETPEFKASMSDEKSYRYFWDFGQGIVKEGASAQHRFDKQGNYTVILSVQDENAVGVCRTERSHQLTVGTQKAYLTAKPLYRDRFNIIAQFATGTWLLLGLLLLSILYYLWKWSGRKALPPKKKTKSLEDYREQFQSLDRAPYFIPFRSKNGQIRSERDLFRFADVLRQRQEGLRKFVDVPRTIQRTINGGGFPQIALATQTQPSEYLFLIDEQSPHSHQSKLFEYLA